MSTATKHYPPTNWDAALARTIRHLKIVQSAARGWTFSHPQWYVRAEVEDYPPRITLRCFLRARGKTRRTITGVDIGTTLANSNTAQALTPTDDELREIGDFVASLETTEFTPRRVRDTDFPWVVYELRVDFRKYEVAR